MVDEDNCDDRQENGQSCIHILTRRKGFWNSELRRHKHGLSVTTKRLKFFWREGGHGPSVATRRPPRTNKFLTRPDSLSVTTNIETFGVVTFIVSKGETQGGHI